MLRDFSVKAIRKPEVLLLAGDDTREILNGLTPYYSAPLTLFTTMRNV
jgi:hypothetical protein